MNKNIVIGFLIVAVVVIGYFSLKQKDVALPPVTTTPISVNPSGSGQTTPATGISVAGMQKFTDSAFGFSFWYPSTWTITKSPKNPPFGANLKSVSVVAMLGLQPAGQTYPSIIIQEAKSTTRTITDTGGAGPIGPVTFYFDATKHIWMTTPPEGDGATKPADVSINTMGGLHMFGGTSRFDTSIVPLTANNFVVIGDGGAANATALTRTIVATDPAVATPVSASDQTKTIETEKTTIQPK
jgi:hypothetical protein